ncbi:MAG: hypothetical protein VKJ02_12335 [Snowella sp.]|nr:hypothetical protein [Snowella sp.]
MMSANIETLVRYVTDAGGKTTEVLVPIEIWQQLISSMQIDSESGLAWIDEYEPKAQILADLKESLKQAAAGETFPISQLWENIT